ncbi:MAG TPA: hypothetical protein VFU88_07230 [Ktedonobacterales bacterium]|nr:hypothetical protein [Ktedonobacterales bacterium]
MATRRSQATQRAAERAATTVAAVPPARAARRSRPLKHLPPVAPYTELSALRALDSAAAREHVNAYLHTVMTAAEADDFEVGSYRWELHLVPLDQLCLLRAVELSRGKLRHYRAAFRRGEECVPLIGLGGEGRDPTRSVLLCDGYHRAVALRDAGLHFAWVWLAVGPWRERASA